MSPLEARPPVRAPKRGMLAAFGALSVTAALASGCGAAAEAAPSRPVAPYSGHAAALFDDTIAPSAVGLDFDRGYSPRLDKTLRERAETADAIVRVRVSTVTAKKDGPEATYQIGLRTVDKIAGEHPPPVDFTVRIDRASDAHGILKSLESRMVGYTFVAFVREFAHPNGDRELHFHLAPDTQQVKAAVEDAMLLGRLK